MAYSSGFSNPFGFVVTPFVKRLIIANVAAFVVTSIAGGLAQYLVLSRGSVIPLVWTPVTYMFVHVGLWHLLFNMLILFFFGPPLEDRWGSEEFLKFYLIAGLGGATLSLLFPYPIAGASGAIYGVMVAFALYWPNNPIYFWGIFPIKAKYLVGFLVGLDLFSAVAGRATGVAHLAHLGGAIAAFLYLRSRFAPSAWGSTPNRGRGRSAAWTQTLASLVKPPPKKAETAEPPVVSASRRREMHRALDDVDHILDKISEGGISSLTEEERRRLEEASKKFRTN
jgi:membrane associated rhomboid family serine protease